MAIDLMFVDSVDPNADMSRAARVAITVVNWMFTAVMALFAGWAIFYWVRSIYRMTQNLSPFGGWKNETPSFGNGATPFVPRTGTNS